MKKQGHNNHPSFIAYSVSEQGKDQSHWQKIGAAWPTKGGGLSLKLNALPLDGKVALRSREELERMRSEKAQSSSQHQDHARNRDRHPGF